MKKIGKTMVQKVVEVEVEVDGPVVEVEGQGLEALLGKNVVLFCMNYTYAGKLVGVNTVDVLLEGAGIVFETGDFNSKTFKDFQKFPAKQWRIRTAVIESYGEATQLG